MVQVPDVLAHERLAFNHQRYRVLKVRTEGQNRAPDRKGCDGSWRITARPSQNYRTEYSSTSDRVVHAAGDETDAVDVLRLVRGR